MSTPMAVEGVPPSRWLCRNEVERLRFLDMNARVRTARRVQGAVVGGVVLVSAFWYGWLLVALVAVAALTLGLLERRQSSERPERDAMSAIAVLELLIAAAVALSGGVDSPLLSFLTVPVVMLAARYRIGVVVWGVAAAVLIAGSAMLAALWLPPAEDAPGIVDALAYLALLASLIAACLALLTAEMQSRGDAVVDPLTGLFNRKALPARFAEAAAQAKVLDGPVALIMCDLDHFKRVNDEHGHDRGDVVLREVAYALRKTLRTFDLVYRLGGEEFAVLLPGLDLEGAFVVGERLIADIAATPLAGLPVTMSAGVASARGDELDLAGLLKAADVALYEAKHAGRNRVHRSNDGAAAVPA